MKWTKEPEPWVRKCSTAAREMLKAPRRWTSSTASQSAGVILWNMPSRRNPAGLMMASRPPKVSIACCTMAWTAARLVTLSELAAASPPAARMAAAVSSAGLAEPSSSPATETPRSFTSTLAPSRAANMAHSRPMPPAPPVTSTTLPSKTPMTLSPLL